MRGICGTGSLLIRRKGDLSADYIQKIISFPSFKRTIEDMAAEYLTFITATGEGGVEAVYEEVQKIDAIICDYKKRWR